MTEISHVSKNLSLFLTNILQLIEKVEGMQQQMRKA